MRFAFRDSESETRGFCVYAKAAVGRGYGDSHGSSHGYRYGMVWILGLWWIPMGRALSRSRRAAAAAAAIFDRLSARRGVGGQLVIHKMSCWTGHRRINYELLRINYVIFTDDCYFLSNTEIICDDYKPCGCCWLSVSVFGKNGETSTCLTFANIHSFSIQNRLSLLRSWQQQVSIILA